MNYPSIRIEGSILSPDILEKLDDANGQRPTDFGLEATVKVKDEIARAWADAQDYWRIYNRKLETLKEDSPATTETRNLWIVPLLGLLGYQLEYEAKSIELNSKLYPISHRVTNRGNAAIQITGSRELAGLDRKPEKAALKMSAHAMMQEYLNLTEQLYGIVTNGKLIRLLRDSSRLVKLTYLEFDLDRIFSDGLFADFAVLYRLLHVTRLPLLLENSADCLLEKYHQETIEQGSRIREGLRVAVTDALQLLGTGFLSHPDNCDLRAQLSSGEIRPDIYFNYVLRLVYRLLFLMVIEERNLVFPKGVSSRNSTIYFQYYSVQRLRRLANTRGLLVARYHDAWQQLLATFHLFENSTGASILGNTAMGGHLFSSSSLGPISSCTISNSALFTALEKLCYFTHPQNGQRMPVNFGALATEEFGSVYESLLELHPVVELEPTPFFGFLQAAGNERKTSGSYYTPSILVDCLLNSALNPLLDNAEKTSSPEQDILALRICDPSCGSGHFLIAAAQRIAQRLARVRSGNEEPSPEALRHSHRDVISHCIYGVDINPMSVELCKVGLWLEAVEPGKPLTFLDHHIKCGNSLLGTTPELIASGLPDEAFNAIEGDDKKACAVLKKRNKTECKGLGPLFAQQDAETQNRLQQAAAKLEELPEERPEDILAKELAFYRHEQTEEYLQKKKLADAWCSAFVIRKFFKDPNFETSASGITQKHLNDMAAFRPLPDDLDQEIERFSGLYKFFHWHLAFPEVFSKGGFDAILGNPPWEKVKVEEKEFFASRAPEISATKDKAKRTEIIEELRDSNPSLYNEFQEARDLAKSDGKILAKSGRYPMTARGEINLYAIFAELSYNLICHDGAVGIILPSGIATDETGRHFFGRLTERRSVTLVLMFDYRSNVFPGVNKHFCLISFGRVSRNISGEFILGCELIKAEDLLNPERRVQITADQVELVNPNTRTCPILRCQRDADLLYSIYNNAEILIKENVENGNPWLIYEDRFQRMFDMTIDRKKYFNTRAELESIGARLKGNIFTSEDSVYLPLYEAKMIHHFDHRWATYDEVTVKGDDAIRDCTVDEKMSVDLCVLPNYWVEKSEVEKRTPTALSWQIGIREITNTTNARTTICSPMPTVAFGNKIPLVRMVELAPQLRLCWLGLASSFALDFASRQKLGALTFNQFYIKQLPFPKPEVFLQPCPWRPEIQLAQWFASRVLELCYTSHEMKNLALDVGYDGLPFAWDESRRYKLRRELDAASFILYGINADDAGYIMETFPLIKQANLQKHDAYVLRDEIVQLINNFNKCNDSTLEVTLERFLPAAVSDIRKC